MTTIGIDIGGRSHAVARCRDGQTRADREILRVEPGPGRASPRSTPGSSGSPSR